MRQPKLSTAKKILQDAEQKLRFNFQRHKFQSNNEYEHNDEDRDDGTD